MMESVRIKSNRKILVQCSLSLSGELSILRFTKAATPLSTHISSPILDSINQPNQQSPGQRVEEPFDRAVDGHLGGAGP
jgi:hypothetical protein